MQYIGVIGTAGRDNHHPMTNELFTRMVAKCEEIIKTISDEKHPLCLVSGGAAWSDHVAVELFLKGKCNQLRLHVPCPWERFRFKEQDICGNPGKSANYYHRKFTFVLGRDTLRDIEEARKKGASLIEGNGFFDRNTNIAAECQYLIAFTWDVGAPKTGGTLDTWKKATKSKRIHVNLNELM